MEKTFSEYAQTAITNASKKLTMNYEICSIDELEHSCKQIDHLLIDNWEKISKLQNQINVLKGYRAELEEEKKQAEIAMFPLLKVFGSSLIKYPELKRMTIKVLREHLKNLGKVVL